MAKTRSEHVAINTGASIAMKLVAQITGFFMKFVLIHTLGAQYTGVAAVFSDILSMLSLMELGIGSAIAFALYKPLKENDDRRIAALMHFYKTAYRLVAALVLAVGLICLPMLPMIIQGKKVPDITENIALIFILFVINTTSSYLLVYKSTILTAGQKRYIISKISIIFSLIRTGVQCILLFVFHNYILFLVVGIVETLVRNYVVSMAADKYYPKIKDYPNERLKKPEVKKLLNDVFALSLYKVNSVVVNSTDTIIIATMFSKGVIEVAALSFYKSIIGTVDTFVNQFYSAVLPSLGNMAADSSDKKQFSIFKALLFITFWVCCFCTTSLFVLLGPFMQLLKMQQFGSQFVQPMSILFALLFDNYVSCMMRPVYNFRNSNGLFVQGKYRPVAMAIIDIGLSIGLAYPLGIFGVLFATTISRICTSVWYEPWLIYDKVFHVPVSDYAKRYAIYGAITVVSCGVTYYLGQLVQLPNAYLNFLYKMVLCVIIPNLMVILMFRKTEEYQSFMVRLKAVGGSAASSIMRRVCAR